MITGARNSDHITPVLKSLHWLPVEARINFKILLITYKILNGQIRRGRAFSTAAPRLWNTIPEYIQQNEESVASFKTKLKTILFKKYFH